MSGNDMIVCPACRSTNVICEMDEETLATYNYCMDCDESFPNTTASQYPDCPRCRSNDIQWPAVMWFNENEFLDSGVCQCNRCGCQYSIDPD